MIRRFRARPRRPTQPVVQPQAAPAPLPRRIDGISRALDAYAAAQAYGYDHTAAMLAVVDSLADLDRLQLLQVAACLVSLGLDERRGAPVDWWIEHLRFLRAGGPATTYLPGGIQ